MRRFALLVAVILFGVLAVPSRASEPVNLLAGRNPSFENGFRKWKFDVAGYQPSYRIVSKVPNANCGVQSLRLAKGTEEPDDLSDYLTTLNSSVVTIPENGKYLVSIWVMRGKYRKTEYSPLYVTLRQEGGPPLEIITIQNDSPKARDVWVFAQDGTKLKAGARVWLEVQTYSYGGEIFIDCASITKK